MYHFSSQLAFSNLILLFLLCTDVNKRKTISWANIHPDFYRPIFTEGWDYPEYPASIIYKNYWYLNTILASIKNTNRNYSKCSKNARLVSTRKKNGSFCFTFPCGLGGSVHHLHESMLIFPAILRVQSESFFGFQQSFRLRLEVHEARGRISVWFMRCQRAATPRRCRLLWTNRS